MGFTQHLVPLTVITIGFVALLLSRFSWVRRRVADLAGQFGPRLIDWVNPPPEFDQQADDLRRALRRERLEADVRRLERILATDMTMSATRQIGNRLAYDWLVRELAEVADAISPLFVTSTAVVGTDRYAQPDLSWNLGSRPAVQHAPKVEILDIGWRH